MQGSLSYLAVLAAAAPEGGPASPFEVNFGLFFWTWVVFITLFLVLKKYAWPAILKATEEREQAIRRQLEEAGILNAQAEGHVAEQHKMLGEAKSQAQQLVAEAKRAAEKERAAALAKTKQEQDALLERAKREIATEQERAILALRREAVDLSLAVASKLIEQRLDSDKDRTLVEGYLSAMESNN